MTPLSFTGKRWILPTETSSDVVAALLKERSLEPLGEGELVEDFGHDARTFTDFPRAAARIRHAIEQKEVIGIVGDYDCDGVTSSALMKRFFERRGVHAIVRLPHRIREGYGLKRNMVEEMRAKNVTLLLTLDTGVTATSEVALAKSFGMDVIIFDHHHLPPTLPAATAILHPALATPMMTPAPCAAGVVWSFISAYEEQEGYVEWKDRETDLALAAIGTIADVMELKGDNRTLVHHGLMALRQLRTGPLALLRMQAGLEEKVTSRDVAFRIAPRINAAGRVSDPHLALQALLGDAHAVLQLDHCNRERQDAVEDALELLLPLAEKAGGPFLCFADAEFSPGICGLLAGRLTERFGKPSLVGCIDGNAITASLRSVPGYHVTEALERFSGHFTSFGGHAMAAGCHFATALFSEVQNSLITDAAASIDQNALIPSLHVDAVLTGEQITEDFYASLQTLEPFGEGNPEPRLLIQNLPLESARAVGKTAAHLQGFLGGHKIIGFGLGHLLPHLTTNVDAVVKLGIDTWHGNRRLQLFVEDLRLSDLNAKHEARNPKQISMSKK